MLARQTGVLNLYWVALFSAVFAALAMAALFSMRYERNLFAEAAAKVGSMFAASPAAQVADSVREGLAPATGKTDVLRKCVIAGKTVISNTDCLDSNSSSKTIEIHETRGVIAPVKPEPVAAPPGSTPAIDKMLEKQLR